MDATKTKPYVIDKKLVYDAYKAVKTNAGAAGVDGQSLEQFAQDLKRNLCKIWNRMSSGSYFPPPVRAVPIPKKNGGQRLLGVPTVADRVAQTVVKHIVEGALEPIFKPDSYGYRPKKSALDAIELRRTCARLCHEAGGELEQIQFLLGHASVQTTERYIGCRQNLREAVNDRFRILPSTTQLTKFRDAA